MVFCVNDFAQEEKLDKYPEPVGGVETIIKNLACPQSVKHLEIQGKVFVTVVTNSLLLRFQNRLSPINTSD